MAGMLAAVNGRKAKPKPRNSLRTTLILLIVVPNGQKIFHYNAGVYKITPALQRTLKETG